MSRRAWLAAALAVPVLLAGCARDEARPSGVTERWLQAVADQGRDGLADDARARADEHAERAATEAVVPADAEDDEALFSDLEVGAATEEGGQARVPFRVTTRAAGGDDEERYGIAVLQRFDGEWRVVAVAEATEDERVPSEGGDRPARASAEQWLAAVALSIILTVGSALVIESQPRPAVADEPARPVQ